MSANFVRRGLGKIKRLVMPGTEVKPSPMSWSGLPDALRRLRAIDVDFRTVIDVGASDGQWSHVARTVYPEPTYVLLEMNRAHLSALQAYASTVPGVEVIEAAAADHDGEVFLDVDKDIYGGRAVNEAREGALSTPSYRLDTLARTHHWEPPFLIKLDTHGFEIEILTGAEEILTSTSAAIIEAYNFQLSKSSVRFHELCAYMEERGFRCFDVFDPLHRHRDGALWQFDMVFIPASTPTLNIPGFQ